MAAMSVIGIDLGNESCYVAVAKAGGIETIANDYSLRSTPSCIAFSGKNRILGVAAKNQQVTNMKNTVYGLKRLLGRKLKDPQVEKERKMLPFSLIEAGNGDIGIKVNYLNEEHVFSPEQCLAMLLTKLKDISSTALQTPINDCVISVPSYFTNNERKALLDSASIAGLNVLRLFNETTATALSYGIYKQDLPAPEEKPRNVVFVDCGYASLQVSACAFNRGKLVMLATAADHDLGGRDIDLILADYFCKEFQAKYKIDAKTNPRAFLRLLTEVEKIKKQMSANSTTLPLNIECFMNDKDVHGDIKRADMEQLCAHLFKRVEETLEKLKVQSGLELQDIHSVEVVGGSTRIPALKQLIENVYKKVPSTTLNQDEAVSRGCALQCAMLSPAVRVRDFNVTDVQAYPISVRWSASEDGEGGNMDVFPINHAVPFSKVVTFYKREPFQLTAEYNGDIPYPDRHIGTWTVRDIRPTAEGKAQKVKVKLRVNRHGIMTVSNALMYEAKESAESEAVEDGQQQKEQEAQTKQNTADGQTPSQNDNDAPMEDAASAATNAAPEENSEKKKKQVVKSVELPIESLTHGFSQVEINQFTEQEYKMIAADRQEKERVDARNALEEYVYELRNKVSSDDELGPFIVESDRDALVRQLDDMENWLYEDGEDCQKQLYNDKLAELKAKGEPVQQRKIEFELRPVVIEDFAKSLQLCMKALELIKSRDQKYAHLTDDEVKKVNEAFSNSYQWLEQTRSKSNNAPKHLAPPVTVAQIRQEKSNFENSVNAILNKAPPKAPSPPKEDSKNSTSDSQEKPSQQNHTQENSENQSSSEKMDWSSST